MNRPKTQEKRGFKHGYRHHKLYTVYLNMSQRCNNPNRPDYKYYGGKGIKCAWSGKPKEFIEWCLQNGWSEGLEIDRIDCSGDYEPKNIRFIKHKENSQRRKYNKLDYNKAAEIRTKYTTGETSTLKLAKEYSVSKSSILAVLHNRSWI